MRDVFVQRLMAMAASDPRIMLITGDLGFGVLDQFERRFPKQYLNAGVAEQNMTALATGLALDGRVVFTYSIGNFPILRCLEQIRNDACYHDANVKIVSIGGGFSYGPLGMSHHATEDLAIMRALSAMTVVAPGDDQEAGDATQAISQRSGTCYLRLDKSGAAPAESSPDGFEIGVARRYREGGDVTLIATGGILGVAIRAADRLAGLGIGCRVLSMHTVKPLDRHAIRRAVAETGGIVTIEEHSIFGGLGGAVAEWCLDSGQTPQSFLRLALPGTHSSIVGSQDYLRAQYGLDEQGIVHRVQRLLRSQRRQRTEAPAPALLPTAELETLKSLPR
jgi:transketolase